jgi:hypothetical protein
LIPLPQHFIYSELRQQGGGFLELGVARAMFLQEAWTVEGLGGSTTSKANSKQLVTEARTNKKTADHAEIPYPFGL